MHKRTGENVISTDMVKEARRSTSAVEEKRRNKEETACAFVGKRVCKRRCVEPATSRRTMREAVRKFWGHRSFICRIFFGTFPSFFFTKHQLRNANTFPRLRDALPSEQKQHPWTAASHCNPGALGVLFYSCTVCAPLSVRCVCVTIKYEHWRDDFPRSF